MCGADNVILFKNSMEVSVEMRRLLQNAGVLTITLMSFAFVSAQAPPKAAPRNSTKPCHEDTHLCSTRVKKDFAAIDAYVKHLKPGAKVGFNPQPDPPGDPSPLYRTAMNAYQRLQYDLYDLSNFPPGPCRIGACHDAIDGANNQFGMLGNATDQRSASSTISELKFDIERLARSLASMRPGQ
jgi:hypothetical protein